MIAGKKYFLTKNRIPPIPITIKGEIISVHNISRLNKELQSTRKKKIDKALIAKIGIAVKKIL
ncbi:hypothetical protein GCM10023313_35590 [Mucilaginibacter defluvii]|uniref:Uncharacterized protein n=1 Tax=Mucilaginibacter defluvii TaxID=1196019 RepID=A0ABP9GAY2_9SPHI